MQAVTGYSVLYFDLTGGFFVDIHFMYTCITNANDLLFNTAIARELDSIYIDESLSPGVGFYKEIPFIILLKIIHFGLESELLKHVLPCISLVS